VFAHVLDNDNMNGSFRVDNSVRYTSPNYAGLTVGGLYGFSNQADGFANNRAYSFGANYANGPIKAALAYTQVNNSATLGNLSGGAVDQSTTSGDAEFTAVQQRTFGGGASYTFGPADVGIVVTNTKLTDATAVGTESTTTIPGADIRFTNYEVNGHYHLSPALTLGLAYDYTDAKYASSAGSASPKWNQVSLLSDYALSKRTDVYAVGSYQHLSDGFAQGTTGIPTAFEGASNYVGGTAASDNQVVVGVGLRTRF
jgi:general bacterial porin, GBP family